MVEVWWGVCVCILCHGSILVSPGNNKNNLHTKLICIPTYIPFDIHIYVTYLYIYI